MNYAIPEKNPFSYNVGICFHTNMTNWYVSSSVKYSRDNQIQYSQDRLEKVVKNFKLIRIYDFFTAGWLPPKSTDLDPCAVAFVNVLKNNPDVEGMISTTGGTKDWLKTPANVQTWVSRLKSELGAAVSQVKTVLIGNEINAHGFTPEDLHTIMGNFKGNTEFMALKIPLSVSFSTLPTQSGDANSDALVKAIVDNWAPEWNDNHPFVFVDPYPDAEGIKDPAGVFKNQAATQNYYRTEKHYSTLQILIAETGAEGDPTNATSVPVIQGIFDQLDNQYQANAGKTVPTFLFEAVDEERKPGTPVQTNMGVYQDQPAADGSKITLKKGITVPGWVSD